MVKRKKKVSGIAAVVALVCAVVIIVSCFLPYFTNTSSAVIVGSTTSEISGFGLISALFANPDSDKYEAKGDTTGEKALYITFANGKKDDEKGGAFTFMLICALAAVVLGAFGVLGSLGLLLSPKGNIGTILKAIFGLSLIFSIVGIILASNLATALSTGINIGGLSLASTVTKVGFGVWLAGIGSLLGLGATFIKL